MTNFEYLLKNETELLKQAILTFPVIAKNNNKLGLCLDIRCDNCDFALGCCDSEDGLHDGAFEKWLDEEYKEPSPYEDWKIDDKIEVSDDGECWYRRHFAGVNENGKPMVWGDGATSWSYRNDKRYKVEWNYARKVRRK
ncbi:MAG: hypothetical protein Q4A76_10490 [Porphyromonadaceae bacterium]|nr:hypothetical protein [Porphyromonadaceae bacterium]